MKFLKPDKMVQNLQLAVYGILALWLFDIHCISRSRNNLVYVYWLYWASINYSNRGNRRSLWAWILRSLQERWKIFVGKSTTIHPSNYEVRFIKVSLSFDPFGLADNNFLLSTLVVIYAVLLIMYIELSSGVLRYSMLDTSIRTNEVYVMNPKDCRKYHRALIINPVITLILATLVLSANKIVPVIVNIFNSDLAGQLRESVELTSVYGLHWNSVCFPSSRWAVRIKSTNTYSELERVLRRMNSNQVITDHECSHCFSNRNSSWTNNRVMPTFYN